MSSDWDSSFQLCVFDMSRGQSDDHEVEKILFFHPKDCPLSAQLSLIGLGEGLITFTKIFSPDSPCREIDSDKRTHVFFQPEEDIWMLMVIEKKKENEVGRISALRSVLEEAYGLFALFFGSIRTLLLNDPTGVSVRSSLQAFFRDYLADLVSTKKILLPAIHESLQERGTIQKITLERNTALEVQSAVDLLMSFFGSGRSCHSLLLFQDLLVSTTLPPVDAARTYAYARMRLLPAIISSTTGRAAKKTSSPGPLKGNVEGAQESSGRHLQPPRPLQHDKWWRDQDGFLSTNAWGLASDGSSIVPPTAWFEEEKMQICVYQIKQLTIILLIPASHFAFPLEGQHFRSQILEKASLKLDSLEEKISREWGGINAYHVPGYRYLCVDHDNKICKASPSNKVNTLSKDSLLSINKVRAEIDAAKARSDRIVSQQSSDMETCVRTRSNAWVVVRVRGNNELYLVLERASETLLLTAEATEKFSRRYCNGIFNSD